MIGNLILLYMHVMQTVSQGVENDYKVDNDDDDDGDGNGADDDDDDYGDDDEEPTWMILSFSWMSLLARLSSSVTLKMCKL